MSLLHVSGILLIYRLYSTAIINVFIMISTWLTVAMSLERYLAICYPLRQDLYLTTRRIKVIIVLTYTLSFLFNVPVLSRYAVDEICRHAVSKAYEVENSAFRVNDIDEQMRRVWLVSSRAHSSNKSFIINDDQNDVNNGISIKYFLRNAQSNEIRDAFNKTPTLSTAERPVYFKPRSVPLWQSAQLESVYRIVWAAINNVIPLILLIYFNVCLCRKIYESYKLRQEYRKKQTTRQDQSSHVLTVTLVVIVVMFFLLVAPSEIVIHVAMLTNTNNTYTYMSVEVVMNFMQCLNFSMNFVLYCIISPYFRKTLKYIFYCSCYNVVCITSDKWHKEFETTLI